MEFKDQTQKTEKIEQFLNGTLSAEEQGEMETLIAQDSKFSQEVEDYKTTFRAIQAFFLMSDLEEIEKEYHIHRGDEKKGRIITFPIIGRWVAAASFILVSLIGLQFALLSKESVLSDISLYEITFSARGGEASQDSVAALFEDFYKKENFGACVDYYENGKFENNLKVTFLTGNAYLALEKPQKAIACFQHIFDLNKQKGIDLYNQHSEWYLAVAYLQNEEYKKARELLDKIQKNEHHLFHDQVDFWLYLRVKMLNLKS